MSGRYLLDTNIVIRLLNADAEIVERTERAAEVVVCAIVLGELFYGAYKSRSVEKNLARIHALSRRGPVLPCDDHTADVYGIVKNELRARGRPIPENDVWIAALARQHQLTIATRDVHFDEVDGLSLEKW